MRTAALVAKAVSRDASAVGALDALEMATLEPARALGLDAQVGSIEAGKSADLAAVELATFETLPTYHPVSQLVYAAGREHVTHVWVAGEPRVEDRRLTGIDEQELLAKARWWQERLAT
jgi:5-methylthioadenosine/S-adenosylhomocysteine deaminase